MSRKMRYYQNVETREDNACCPCRETDITEAVELLVDGDRCGKWQIQITF